MASFQMDSLSSILRSAFSTSASHKKVTRYWSTLVVLYSTYWYFSHVFTGVLVLVPRVWKNITAESRIRYVSPPVG